MSSGKRSSTPEKISHGSGAYPYLAGRFDILHAPMDKAAQADVAQKQPSAYAPMMVYDTIVHAPKPLKFLADLVGLDRLVLGTDYSFPPADLNPLESLRAAGSARRTSKQSPRQIRGGFFRGSSQNSRAAR